MRQRWRVVAALALLLGLICGVVLMAAAGARRTETAYPRLLRWANAAQILLISGQTTPSGYYAALRRLPQVASMSVGTGYNMLLPARHGSPFTLVEAFSSGDGSLGISADRVKILAGHLFSRASPPTAMIDEQLATAEHLRPGSMLRLLAIPANPRTGANEPGIAPLAFRVSAIVVFDSQIVPATMADAEPAALLSPSFTRMPRALSYSIANQAGVRLRPGASVAAFQRAATALARRYPAVMATGGFNIVNLAGSVAATESAIRPQAIALGVFAGLLGLIALAIIVPLLSRQLALDSVDLPTLRALGMTNGRFVGLSLARLAVVTGTAGIVAVLIAIAASPLMPIGPARVAEPSPGIEVNLAILGTGLAAIAVLPLALVVPVAWRAAWGRAALGGAGAAGRASRSRLGLGLGLAGSLTGAIGVRMAFEPGHGRTAVPVRSALAGSVVALAAIVAAMVFGTSFVHLIDTPRLYGQDWQQELDLGFGAVPRAWMARVMKHQTSVAGYAVGDYGLVSIGGEAIPAIGIDPVRGTGFLSTLAGSPAPGPGEIMLGARTLRAVHGRVGETVQVTVNRLGGGPGAIPLSGAHRMRVAGEAVFAAFSRGSFAATDLGDGALVPASLLSQPFPPTHCTGALTCYNFALVRYKQGTSLPAAAVRLTAAANAVGCPPSSCLVTGDQRPSDIRNYTGVRDTPLALGVVLALLAVGTFTNVLVTTVRRRRRDFAVLKTLGLAPSQLLRVVSWEASAIAAAALVVGLPLGLLAGRWSWALFASSAGVTGTANIPVQLVLLVIPVTLLLAVIIAARPGQAAARTRPAAILRNE
jgi:FtsX-like permease family